MVKEKNKTILLSLLVMALWGSLFPCVKLGYRAFGIDAVSIPDILMFAALRFFLCGAGVCGYCYAKRKVSPPPSAGNVWSIIFVGVFAIVLHYACTYIGLSTTDSSKTAILKQTGALIYVCFSFLAIREERFSIFKIVGALVGFCGVMAINYTGGGFEFSAGDILILGASFCTVVANILSRKSAGSCAPQWITGISQLFGGGVLLVWAASMGGKITTLTPEGATIFIYICVASVVSYTLWYRIQRTSLLSGLFIIKFAEPLFACFFGAMLLGEDIWRIQYPAAFVLISLGIVVANYRREEYND